MRMIQFEPSALAQSMNFSAFAECYAGLIVYGTDIAMQGADMTLIKGDLRGIVRARRLSKATMETSALPITRLASRSRPASCTGLRAFFLAR